MWQSELTELFAELTEFAPQTQWGSVSSLLRNSTLETAIRPFPNLFQAVRKGGLSFKGVVVMAETALNIEATTTVKIVTVASFSCIL